MTAKQNSYLEQVEQKARSMWLLLTRLWDVAGEVQLMDGQITEIRIKRPRFDGDDTMVIVKALAEGKKYVSFHTSGDAPSALVGALSRLDAQQLKWREDQYLQKPGGPEEAA